MGNVLINEETLSAIADAVRARGGTSAKMKPAEIPEAVNRIPSGRAGADMSLPIRFFDYEGTLLYSFSLEELAGMESLPDLPFHEGLICTGWNWTLEDLKKTNREMNVAALYVTDDGATRIYVSLDEDMLEPQVSFGQRYANSVKVDWGDGSEQETADGAVFKKVTLTHRYAEPGDYVIRFLPQEDSSVSFMGNYDAGSWLFTSGADLMAQNMKYLSAVRKIEAGKKVYQFDSYCFCGFFKLESITLAETDMLLGNGIVKCCYGLNFLGLPGGWGSVPGYLCDQCSGLKNVSIPNGAETISTYAFSECSSLERITLPETVTVIEKYGISGCLSLAGIHLPEKVRTIEASAFRDNRVMEKITLRSGMTELSDYSFSKCYMLREMVIPDTVGTVQRYCFENCKGMKKYYFLSIWPPKLTAINAFTGITKDCKIYVPSGMLKAYQEADNWSFYASYMEEMEGDVP